jgi:hypothetical protein
VQRGITSGFRPSFFFGAKYPLAKVVVELSLVTGVSLAPVEFDSCLGRGIFNNAIALKRFAEIGSLRRAGTCIGRHIVSNLPYKEAKCVQSSSPFLILEN